MNQHPVTLYFAAPARWDRTQLLLRLVIFVALAILGVSLGWLTAVCYLILPILAAVWAAPGYDEDTRGQLLRGVRYWNAVIAYLLFVTDRFPNDADSSEPRIDVAPGEAHTPGSALLRLITSIPAFLVLAILSWVGGIVWLIAAFGVLVSGRVFQFAWRYFRFVVALHARWLVYHASLADEYPAIGTPHEDQHPQLSP